MKISGITKYLFFVVLVAFLSSCENEGGGDGYFFEDEYEEELAENQGNKIPENLQTPNQGEKVNSDSIPTMDFDSIPNYQDQEPEAKTVKDIIKLVMTDGKLDTAKVTGMIVNTLAYVAKDPMGASFACEKIAYFGTNIMLPIGKNETSASLYLEREFNGNRYHFIIINFRGYVSGKNYVVECSRNDFSYKELFVFYPSAKTRTQSSMLIAITDANLSDVETMININWRVGEEKSENKDYGVVQYVLNKKIPC